MQSSTAIGIDLGGTQIKGVLINASGEIIKSRISLTNANNEVGEWKTEIAAMVNILRENEQSPVSIGLSAPGLSNDRNSAIAHLPSRLVGLEHYEWNNLLKHPQVSVLNDAHAALVAESRIGVGKGIRNQVMLTLGTGVGGAILIDGQLYQGFLQRAGHVGHMTLNTEGKPGILDIPGTLEEAFGNASVEKRTNGRYQSCRQLVDAYNNADTIASFFWLQAVHKLSLALASLINILSPELIILGGGITKAKSALLDPLNEFMWLYEWTPGGIKTQIRLSAFDEFSGAVGAALYSLTIKQKASVE